MIGKAGFKEKLCLLTGRRKIFRVEGSSMSPTLENGDVVLIDTHSEMAENAIILADHPYKKSVKMLKRLTGFSENGEMVLVGDNTNESTDSRTFGSVPLKNFRGVVTSRLSQYSNVNRDTVSHQPVSQDLAGSAPAEADTLQTR